jgi:branched-chain amino acid transport system ATP-binding protein
VKWFEVNGVWAGYSAAPVLRGVSLEVEPGEVVAVVGSNGAGKTTLLNAICGLVPVSRGEIVFDGARIDSLSTREIVSRGIAQVPEGRQLFSDMTVEENLRLGAYLRKGKEVADDLEEMFTRFPVLGERRTQEAGRLSGGEQQMLAIARALMSAPRLLLLDEPSIGLAPRIVREVAGHVIELAKRGSSVILVEQNVELALSVAARAYVLGLGEVRVAGHSEQLRGDAKVREAYLTA